MKSNVLKRVLSFILLITLLMISTVSFAAKPQTDSVQWTHIYSVTNYLDDSSTWLLKRLELYVSMQTYPNHYAGVSAQLQKLGTDGVTWSDVSGKYFESYEEDVVADIYETKIGVSSGTYRFYVEYTAYSTGGLPLETVGGYTNEVTV